VKVGDDAARLLDHQHRGAVVVDGEAVLEEAVEAARRHIGERQDDEDFRERLEELQEELEQLHTEAARLQAVIAQNVAELLEV
jgi:hypothetical protein